jgi:hypothetical protein
MSRRALLALGAALAACGPRAPRAPAPETAATPATVVALERGPCFGTCPVYRVTLSADGLVEFVGTRFVSRVGADSARIAPEAVDGLVRALEAGGFFALADAYVPDAPACGRYHTDAPTVSLSVQAPERAKTVRHDHGCGGAPEELTRLEHLVDSVAGSTRWIGQ